MIYTACVGERLRCGIWNPKVKQKMKGAKQSNDIQVAINCAPTSQGIDKASSNYASKNYKLVGIKKMLEADQVKVALSLTLEGQELVLNIPISYPRLGLAGWIQTPKRVHPVQLQHQ